MRIQFKNILFVGITLLLGLVIINSRASSSSSGQRFRDAEDSLLMLDSQDTIPLGETPKYHLKNDAEYPNENLRNPKGIQLKNPSNMNSDVKFDPATRQYTLTNTIGNINYRRPATMSLDEYRKYEMHRAIRDYWVTQANG